MNLLTHILTTEPAKSPLAYGLAAVVFGGMGGAALCCAGAERRTPDRIAIVVFAALSFLLAVFCGRQAKVLWNALPLKV